MGLFLRKNHLLRCWSWLSLLIRIRVLTLFLLLKLPQRKIEPWFVLWSFLLPRLLCITTNLPHNHAWIIVVMSGLGLLIVEFPLFPYLEPPYFWRMSIHYSDRLHGVSVIIPKFNKDVYVNSFFPHTARLWNSLTIQWFSLTYDLNGFKSRIKTSFNCRFFLNRFPVFFNYFVLLFLVTPCLIVAVQPCMEWIPYNVKNAIL